jgi:hypothetical protein
MDEQAKSQETARKASDAARKTQERAKDAANEATRLAGQLASVGTETMAVWADVNQQIAHDVMEMSSTAVVEGARLLSELQAANLEALREMQAAAFRWQTLWPEAFRDPIRWYQRAMEESIDTAHRTFGLSRRNAETMTQTFERMQSSAEEAARTLQDTFKAAASKMQDVYARTERLRAA